MTQKETAQFIADIKEQLRLQREENNKFKEQITQLVQAINQKVEQKHLPLSLESEVMNSVNTAVGKAINDALGSYNSPLGKYAHNVITKYQSQIEKIFDDAVAEGITTPEFKQSAKHHLVNRIAKLVLSGLDGSTEKVVQQMKQDTVFRSRLTLFVNGLVEEFISIKQ